MDASESFCAHVAELQQKIASAEGFLKNSRETGAADAQAETLAWVSGINGAWIANAMPILIAVVFELCAGLGFFAAAPAVAKQDVFDLEVIQMPSAEAKPQQRLRDDRGRFLPRELQAVQIERGRVS